MSKSAAIVFVYTPWVFLEIDVFIILYRMIMMVFDILVL